MNKLPLIGTGNLSKGCLAEQVAIITGAGSGIGFEAARALAWLGASVVIAEINQSGKAAAEQINREIGPGSAAFIRTDVGSRRSVTRLAKFVRNKFGKADIVLNNATIAPLGPVTQVPIEVWDASYRVNLRGPVLLAREFLPGMINYNKGVFVCVGSEGLGFMGAYECFKAAQLHLGQTIDAETEDTGVYAFTIGPGMVPTATAIKGVDDLARFTGRSAPEMHAIVKEYMISVEEAGAGFAAAICLADKFQGQEISSKQALIAAGIEIGHKKAGISLDKPKIHQALELCRQVRTTLNEQVQGWRQRSVFERQWMLREFKKYSEMTTEQWLETLIRLEQGLEQEDVEGIDIPLEKLARFYTHLQDLARGYTKDSEELKQNLAIIQGWIEAVNELNQVLTSK